MHFNYRAIAIKINSNFMNLLGGLFFFPKDTYYFCIPLLSSLFYLPKLKCSIYNSNYQPMTTNDIEECLTTFEDKTSLFFIWFVFIDSLAQRVLCLASIKTRCWKFQLSILKNKKVSFLKKIRGIILFNQDFKSKRFDFLNSNTCFCSGAPVQFFSCTFQKPWLWTCALF